MSTPRGFEDKVAFVWKVADKLRGDFKPHEYGSVILPLLVLRRLDCVLAPTKAGVSRPRPPRWSRPEHGQDPILKRTAGQAFYNISPLTSPTCSRRQERRRPRSRTTSRGFSPGAQEVLEEYSFDDKITRLDKAGILYQVLGEFADLDLRPERRAQRGDGLHLRGTAPQVLRDEQRDRR